MPRIADYVAKLTLDTQGAKASLKSLDQSVGNSGKLIGNIGNKLRENRLLFAGASAAGIAGFRSLVLQGSKLQESITAVQATFGDASDAVLKFGESASDTVLLSRREFNDFAVGLAPFLKSAGLEGDELNQTLFNVIQRAADTASVLGKDVGDILNKFTAGFSGEAEPLKRIGVFVSQSALQEQALAEGISKATSEMTEQEKVALRINAVLAQTADKAGDVEKNFDSVAIQLQRNSALTENLTGDLGQNLQPVMQKIQGVTSTVLEAFNGLSEETQNTALIIGGLTVGLSALALLAAPVLAVVSAIGAIPVVITAGVAAIGVLAAKFQGFRNVILGVVDTIKDFFNLRLFGDDPFGSVFNGFKRLLNLGRPTERSPDAPAIPRGAPTLPPEAPLDIVQRRVRLIARGANVNNANTTANNNVEVNNNININSNNPMAVAKEVSKVVSQDVALAVGS